MTIGIIAVIDESVTGIEGVTGRTRGSVRVAARVAMIGIETTIAIEITAVTVITLPNCIPAEVTMKTAVNAALDEFFSIFNTSKCD